MSQGPAIGNTAKESGGNLAAVVTSLDANTTAERAQLVILQHLRDLQVAQSQSYNGAGFVPSQQPSIGVY